MPYIKETNRVKFEGILNAILDLAITSPGELNYLLTCICQLYQNEKGQSYATHNELIGVLECVKQEWYRRQTAPYEEEKIKENGDVEL